MEQVSTKTALVIYFIIIPFLAISGYINQTLLMMYFAILAFISILLTMFGD